MKWSGIIQAQNHTSEGRNPMLISLRQLLDDAAERGYGAHGADKRGLKAHWKVLLLAIR